MEEIPMPETILVEREGRVAILTVNRPDKLNALNEQVRNDMLAALAEIERDDGVGVVVITGAGEKSFIAGADIGEFAGRTPFDQREAMRSPRIFDVMGSFPKPVIAMINGFCLGGGCELASSCDLRVASDKARFGQPEINLGLIPGGGGTQRLPRLVGLGQAMRLILTGDMIGAAEAREIGLVDLVVPARGAAGEDPGAGGKDRRQEPAHPAGRQGGGAGELEARRRGGDRLRARPLLPLLLDRRQGGGGQGLPREAPGAVDRAVSVHTRGAAGCLSAGAQGQAGARPCR